jgi:hypothetical protein
MTETTSNIRTLADLAELPPVIPVALADEILGIGSTLSKRLRARGQYPIRLLPQIGRHHKVSTADLLAYLNVAPSGRETLPA